MTPAERITLRNALQGDANLTAFVAAGNDGAIYDYLGSVSTTSVTIQHMPEGDFIIGVLVGIASLNGVPSLQNKWDRYLRVIKGLGTLRTALPGVQGLISQLVTDGLMTQPQVDAFSKRLATKGEVILGVGAVISITDIAQTLRP